MNYLLQTSIRLMVLAGLSLALAVQPAQAQTWESELVYEGSDGYLQYVEEEHGHRIPDFSYAGYRGGGVKLPDVPTVLTVQPVGGDNTAHLQEAIDEVAAREPDENGFRGAVLLEAGTYEVQGTLYVREGGVVIRGVGDDEDPAANTVLHRTGTSQDPIIYLGRNDLEGGNDAIIDRDGARAPATITDDLVPLGARSFNVDHPERFSEGDPIVVFHPTTVGWLQAVNYGGTADDQDWPVREDPIAFARRIQTIDGSTITIDAPVYNPLDQSLSPTYIYYRDRSGVIEEVGVESLRIDIETLHSGSEDHAENAVVFGFVENAWAEDVTALHFWHAGISVQESMYVTVRGSRALDPHSQITGSRRYNFETYHSQLILFEDNYATEARHAYVANGETRDSGIAFVNNISEDAHTSSEAHRKWSMGILYDQHTELGSSGSSIWDRRIHLGNRGDYGTAHGWACANCVIWNAEMNGSVVVVEKPPTAQNFAIGVQGKVIEYGPFTTNTQPYVEGTGQEGLMPASLYLRQLQDRLEGGSVEAKDDAMLPDDLLLQAYPNPFRENVTISLELDRAAQVQLFVYDVLGRHVRTLADSRFVAGRHRLDVSAGDLSGGTYFVRVQVSDEGGVRVKTLPLRLVR